MSSALARSSTSLALVAALLAPVALAAPAEAVSELIAAGTVHGGYYPDHFLLNGDDIDAITRASGARPSLVGLFMDASAPQGVEADIPGKFNFTVVQLNATWSASSTPFVNVKTSGSAADVAAGTRDADIARWAGYVKRWLDGENGGGVESPIEGRSLIIAPFQEMNWNGMEPYQCDPASFKIAYRKVVDAFRSLGVDGTQVRFAFAPNGATAAGCGEIADYYPGADYVDFVAVSAYNWNGIAGHSISASEALWGPFSEFRGFAPEKPYLVAQTAGCSSNGDRERFIADMFAWVAADANAVGLVWFNFDKECDWRVWDGSTVTPAWAGSLQGATYAHPIEPWFGEGELRIHIPDTADLCSGPECDSIAVVDGGARFILKDGTTRHADSQSLYFGNPGDLPLMGDWDCDGVPTPGQYRQSDGFVYLRNSNTSGVGEIRFFFGDPGDVPVVGDFDGDGCDTVSIYRPTTGQFFIINRLGADEGGLGAADTEFLFGDPGDKPFVGDFDGDGSDTVGLHRESTGLVYFRNSHTSGAADSQFIYGDPGDIVIAGDWDGNGKDSVGLYRPGDGMVHLRASNSAGPADASFYVGEGFIALLLGPRG